MTRPFALRLILLGLIISATAYSYHRYQLQRANAAIIDYAVNLSWGLVDRQSMNIDADLREARDLIKDATKVKFFPLHKIYDKIEAADTEFSHEWNETNSRIPFERLSKEEKLTNLRHVRELSERLLSEVVKTISSTNQELQEALNLTDEEMATINEAYTNSLVDDMPVSLLEKAPITIEEDQLRYELIRQSFNHRLQELLFSASSFGCIRKLQFDQYFPIILTDFDRVLEPGERKELKIGIGSYTTDLAGKEVDLRVNGQQMLVGRDGIAKYSVTGGDAGEKRLFLSATIKDRKTGEETKGESIVTYSVKR